MNHKELPLSKKGNLAPTTASAPLIDSVVSKNKICIEATEGANGPAQNIRNIYIIHKNKVTAFRTLNPKVTCESVLKKN